MQDAQQTKLAAEEAGVLGQFLQGCGGGLRQQVINLALLPAGEGAQSLGQSEGEHKKIVLRIK